MPRRPPRSRATRSPVFSASSGPRCGHPENGTAAGLEARGSSPTDAGPMARCHGWVCTVGAGLLIPVAGSAPPLKQICPDGRRARNYPKFGELLGRRVCELRRKFATRCARMETATSTASATAAMGLPMAGPTAPAGLAHRCRCRSSSHQLAEPRRDGRLAPSIHSSINPFLAGPAARPSPPALTRSDLPPATDASTGADLLVTASALSVV